MGYEPNACCQCEGKLEMASSWQTLEKRERKKTESTNLNAPDATASAI